MRNEHTVFPGYRSVASTQNMQARKSPLQMVKCFLCTTDSTRCSSCLKVLASRCARTQVYSFHTYGKTGASLNSTVSGLVTSVNAVHTPASSPLPVSVTEHASHTASSWSTVRLALLMVLL